MTINRTEIPEIQSFKKITPVEYCTFGSGFKLGGQCSCIWSKFPEYSKDLPYLVVKNHQDIGLTNSCIIETFKSLARCHCTITNNCYNMPALTFGTGCNCHTKSCR